VRDTCSHQVRSSCEGKWSKSCVYWVQLARYAILLVWWSIIIAYELFSSVLLCSSYSLSLHWQSLFPGSLPTYSHRAHNRHIAFLRLITYKGNTEIVFFQIILILIYLIKIRSKNGRARSNIYSWSPKLWFVVTKARRKEIFEATKKVFSYNGIYTANRLVIFKVCYL